MVLAVFGLSSLLAAADPDSVSVTGVAYHPGGEVLSEFPIKVDDNRVFFTDEEGRFSMQLQPRKKHTLVINYYGTEYTRVLKARKPGAKLNIEFRIGARVLEDVQINRVDRDVSVVTMKPRELVKFPTIQFESVLRTIGLGVSGRGGELSSAYNVRGGNFDENLIYINDIEVYRPFLARSGQQEGLSFVNPYLTDNVTFSSGGFAAKYGDKLSSVLDVEYNKPTEFSGSAEVSLLGASVHVQGRPEVAGRRDRFTYVIGARYRTLQYILGSLDVSGDYRPRFADFQALLGYDLNSDWKLSWFSTYAQNQYEVEPQSRQTNFGTIQNARQLFVGFGGSERIEYRTFLNALTLEYEPNDSTEFKIIGSNFNSKESEHFTVEGAYRLSELENNFGSDNFAEARALLGFGYFINHARNDLDIDVSSLKALTKVRRGRHRIEVGVKYQSESIFDKLKEWNYNDSSQYRVNAPDYPAHEIHLDDYIKATNQLNSHRIMAYIQDEIALSKRNNINLTAGVRTNYWSLNGQNLISPRMQFSFEPNKRYNDRLKKKLVADFDSIKQRNDSLGKKSNYLTVVGSAYDTLKRRDVLIKAAFGAYGQPPFYRELRDIRGVLNPNLQAQQSYHVVLGSDFLFSAWNRRFRFINELYYKHLTNLVPYTINNVKLRYDAVNASEGYAYGFDARVNGEFIAGLESWINLSLLSTRENITYENDNGEMVETGYIKRPTDQRVNFSILFQDELPLDTTFKLQLKLIVGSKMPYYFNGPFRYQETFSLPAYRRVDIGFSKEIKRFTKADKNGGRFNSLWMSLEVFNILQVNNVASYFWVRDLSNNLYGVPNYLTGRRLNLKIIGRF